MPSRLLRKTDFTTKFVTLDCNISSARILMTGNKLAPCAVSVHHYRDSPIRAHRVFRTTARQTNPLLHILFSALFCYFFKLTKLSTFVIVTHYFFYHFGILGIEIGQFHTQ